MLTKLFFLGFPVRFNDPLSFSRLMWIVFLVFLAACTPKTSLDSVVTTTPAMTNPSVNRTLSSTPTADIPTLQPASITQSAAEANLVSLSTPQCWQTNQADDLTCLVFVENPEGGQSQTDISFKTRVTIPGGKDRLYSQTITEMVLPGGRLPYIYQIPYHSNATVVGIADQQPGKPVDLKTFGLAELTAGTLIIDTIDFDHTTFDIDFTFKNHAIIGIPESAVWLNILAHDASNRPLGIFKVAMSGVHLTELPEGKGNIPGDLVKPSLPYSADVARLEGYVIYDLAELSRQANQYQAGAALPEVVSQQPEIIEQGFNLILKNVNRPSFWAILRNTGQSPIAQSEIVVRYYDKNGKIIRDGVLMVDLLMPGQDFLITRGYEVANPARVELLPLPSPVINNNPLAGLPTTPLFEVEPEIKWAGENSLNSFNYMAHVKNQSGFNLNGVRTMYMVRSKTGQVTQIDEMPVAGYIPAGEAVGLQASIDLPLGEVGSIDFYPYLTAHSMGVNGISELLPSPLMNRSSDWSAKTLANWKLPKLISQEIVPLVSPNSPNFQQSTLRLCLQNPLLDQIMSDALLHLDYYTRDGVLQGTNSFSMPVLLPGASWCGYREIIVSNELGPLDHVKVTLAPGYIYAFDQPGALITANPRIEEIMVNDVMVRVIALEITNTLPVRVENYRVYADSYDENGNLVNFNWEGVLYWDGTPYSQHPTLEPGETRTIRLPYGLPFNPARIKLAAVLSSPYSVIPMEDK